MLKEMKRNLINGLKQNTIGTGKCVKSLYEIIKEGGFPTYLQKQIRLDNINEDGVILLFDDTVIAATMTIGGCATMLNIQGRKVPLVIIEERFKGTDIEKAIYLHEIGHVKNDLPNKKDCKRVYSDELAADMYAAKEMGAEKFINALKVIREETFGYCTTELDMRIAEITVNCGLDW